jgi:hypothetical protein
MSKHISVSLLTTSPHQFKATKSPGFPLLQFLQLRYSSLSRIRLAMDLLYRRYSTFYLRLFLVSGSRGYCGLKWADVTHASCPASSPLHFPFRIPIVGINHGKGKVLALNFHPPFPLLFSSLPFFFSSSFTSTPLHPFDPSDPHAPHILDTGNDRLYLSWFPLISHWPMLTSMAPSSINHVGQSSGSHTPK